MINDLLDNYDDYVNLDETKDKYKTIEQSNIVVINSKDRNYKIDTNYNFSINFNSINNSNILNINTNFKNITSITMLGLIIPNIYVDIKEVIGLHTDSLISNTSLPKRFLRISDLPYLQLTISDIKNKTMIGSNKEINKSTYILVLDDINEKTINNSGSLLVNGSNFSEHLNLTKNILANTDKKIIYLKDFTLQPINFYSSPQNYLNNINITLSTPEGHNLYNLSNYLECSSIESNHDSTPNKIIITFSKYFSSEEFSIGDKIIFKDIVLSDSSLDNSLKIFLMRNEGHSILALDSENGSNRLFKEIHIPFEYSIDLENGSASIKNNFGLTTTSKTFSNGFVFNLSLQVIFGLQINTEKRDNELLHGNLI